MCADRSVAKSEIEAACKGTLTKDEMGALIVRMEDEMDELRNELDEVRSTRDEAERERDDQDSEAFNVLRAVREWFDDVILFGKTTRTPREIVRKVERALSAEGKGS